MQRPCGCASPTWLRSPAGPSISLRTASGTSSCSGSCAAPLGPPATSPGCATSSLPQALRGFPASHSRALVPVEGPPSLSRDCGGAGAAEHAGFLHVGPHPAAPAGPEQPAGARDAVTSRTPQGALRSCRLSWFLVHERERESESRAGAWRASRALPEPRSATCRTAPTRHGPRRGCRHPTRRGARGPPSPCRRRRMAAQVSSGDSRAMRRHGATLGARRPHACGFASHEELACLTCS